MLIIVAVVDFLNSMSKLHESRSRGRSLSVKQLIDERIKKLEDQQISEIEAAFSQRQAVITNSIRVKALKLRNELVSIESIEATAATIHESIGCKLSVLLDILTEICRTRPSLGMQRIDLEESIRNITGPSHKESEELVDIDGYVEEILQFDESVRSQFDQYTDNSKSRNIEEEISQRIVECVRTTVVDGICGSLRRDIATVPSEADVPYARIPKPQAGNCRNSSHLPRSSDHGTIHQEKIESAKALIKRLQSNAELEYHTQRQIDDELALIDGKYLKLLAEASFSVYEESVKPTKNHITAGLDPAWTRKVLPAILKSNDTLVRDIIRVLSSYVSDEYSENRRIQKLVQIESSKSNFN